jgi:predicted nuclease of predicted toxin-antitoxin system
VTPPRFLIDENLSPKLVEVARDRGYEAMHVNHLGLRTEADWELLKVVAENDWVLVTNNLVEFRGRYRQIDLHPGIIFLVPILRRPQQRSTLTTARAQTVAAVSITRGRAALANPAPAQRCHRCCHPP